MSTQIKQWCDAILFHEDNLELGTCKTLKMITDEANKLTAEISRLQAENERLNKVFQNQGNLREEIIDLKAQLRTAEQRVARECLEIMDFSETYEDAVGRIKAKYGL